MLVGHVGVVRAAGDASEVRGEAALVCAVFLKKRILVVLLGGSVRPRLRCLLDLTGTLPSVIEVLDAWLFFGDLVLLLLQLSRLRGVLLGLGTLDWRAVCKVEVRVGGVDQLRVDALALRVQVAAALAGRCDRVGVVTTRVALCVEEMFVVPQRADPVSLDFALGRAGALGRHVLSSVELAQSENGLG